MPSQNISTGWIISDTDDRELGLDMVKFWLKGQEVGRRNNAKVGWLDGVII